MEPAVVHALAHDEEEDGNEPPASSSAEQAVTRRPWWRRKAAAGLFIAIAANALTYVAILTYSIHAPPVTYSYFASRRYGAPVAFSAALHADVSPASAVCPSEQNADDIDDSRLVLACKAAPGDATLWQSAILAVGEGFGFLLGPAIGQLSDAWGRMRFLLLYIVGTFAAVLPLALYVWTGMAMGKVQGGLMPYYAMALLQGVVSPRSINDIVCSAGVGDAAPARHFSWLTGLGQSGFAFGVLVGPLVSSHLTTPRAFIVSLAIFALTIVIVLAAPDTLAKENRKPLNANVWRATLALVRGFGVLLEDKRLIPLAVGSFFGSFTLFVNITVVPPFFLSVLGFSVAEYGYLLMVIGANMLICKTILAHGSERLVGRKTAIVVSSMIGAVLFVCFGLVQMFTTSRRQLIAAVYLINGLQVAAMAPPLLISASLHLAADDEVELSSSSGQCPRPSKDASSSRSILAGEHGRVQGAMQGVISIAAMAGTLASAAVFAETTKPAALGGWTSAPGVPFLCAAASMLLTGLPVLLFSRAEDLG